MVFFFFVATARHHGWVAGLRASLASAGFSLLFGGYWYARNWLLTGFLFYPRGSEDLHRRIMHPDLTQTTLAMNDSVLLADLYLDAIWRRAGPLQYGLMLILPTIAIMLSVLSLRDWRRKAGDTWLLLLALIGTCAPS